MLSKVIGSQARMIIAQDINEDGRFDLLVQTMPEEIGAASSSAKSDIHIILNNREKDSFYFKSSMVYKHPSGEHDYEETSKQSLHKLSYIISSESAPDKHF